MATLSPMVFNGIKRHPATRLALAAASPLAIAIALSVSCVLSATTARAADDDARDQLHKAFNDYYEQVFKLRPTEASRLGDRRFDHLLDDVSKGARQHWLELDRSTLKELPRRVPYAKLQRNDQIDFEIFRQELVKSIWLAENTKPFEEDPRVYTGLVSDGVYQLLTQSAAPKETNIRNSLARMEHVPEILNAARAALQHPPKQLLETAIKQNQGAMQFYESGILELVGDTTQREALKAKGAAVAAALREYQTFLEKDLRPRATGDWRLGKARFYRKLELELDAGMNADEVLAAAESEFKRVSDAMFVVSRQLWSRYFPHEALPPDDAEGRRTAISRVMKAVGKEHGEGSHLVEDARALVARIKSFISASDFLRLPAPDRCQIIEMPEFQRGNSVAYLNPAPPLSPESPSFYAISPPASDWTPEQAQSLLEEYNQHMLQVLTIHEAYPGHYVQLEYSNRAKSPIRKILQSGPFIEGWAVYTEQTMLDQGYGDGDLRLRLMQLKFYLRAVVNAILDHRMHCSNLTDEDAMRLLTEQAFQSKEEARLKVIRAKQSSVQLSTYFTGRMAIYRLRQAISRDQGASFDLGRFHEAVLDHGSVPLKYLPELVRGRLAKPR